MWNACFLQTPNFALNCADVARVTADNIQPLGDRHEQEFRTILPVPPPPRIHRKPKESDLSRAVDSAFRFSMFLKGYAPGTTLAMVREKQEKEAELHSRQVGAAKVQSWLEEWASYLFSLTMVGWWLANRGIDTKRDFAATRSQLGDGNWRSFGSKFRNLTSEQYKISLCNTLYTWTVNFPFPPLSLLYNYMSLCKVEQKHDLFLYPSEPVHQITWMWSVFYEHIYWTILRDLWNCSFQIFLFAECHVLKGKSLGVICRLHKFRQLDCKYCRLMMRFTLKSGLLLIAWRNVLVRIWISTAGFNVAPQAVSNWLARLSRGVATFRQISNTSGTRWEGVVYQEIDE